MSSSKLVFARKMRQAPTPAEAILWSRLRRKQVGVRWRRQALMLGYIVDFYCPARRLVVEADGLIHESRLVYDAKRDAVLRSHGLTVLRLPNALIEHEPNRAVREITKALDACGIAGGQRAR